MTGNTHQERVQPVSLTWLYLIREPLLLIAGALAYFGVRGLTNDQVDQAQHNSAAVERLEQALHLDVVRTVQGAIIDHPLLVNVVNWIYIYGHWPVIIPMLLWLLFSHPDLLRRVRSTMLISGGLALVVFAMFPVAPPRLHLAGIVDTVTVHSHVYRVLQPPAFVNINAAMPSLHVGWNLLVGITLAQIARRTAHRLARTVLTVLALVVPPFMVFSVLATANHYVLDALAGTALVLIIWFAYGQLIDTHPANRQ